MTITSYERLLKISPALALKHMELIATLCCRQAEEAEELAPYSAGSARSGEKVPTAAFTDERNLRSHCRGEKPL